MSKVELVGAHSAVQSSPHSSFCAQMADMRLREIEPGGRDRSFSKSSSKRQLSINRQHLAREFWLAGGSPRASSSFTSLFKPCRRGVSGPLSSAWSW